MTKVVVVGAGVAGLATAGLLAQRGFEVRVLEKNEGIGGRAGSFARHGFHFDTGPSWYLMPRVFDHFFAMMGTSTSEQLDLKMLRPGYRIFPEPDAPGAASVPITVPHGSGEVIELFETLEPGAGRRLQTYLASAQHVTKLAEDYFLYNPFTRISSLLGREVLSSLPKLPGLLLRSLQGYVAARFEHPVIRQMLGYPAVFLGTDPARAPAMYHLMSALDLQEGVQYPAGGFSEVVARIGALAEQAGATMTTNAEVTRILTSTGGGKHPQVTGVRWVDDAGQIHAEETDVVVSAADLHHTETTLLDAPHRSYPEPWWQRRTSGPGALIVMLGVTGDLEQLPHHSLFFTADWSANFEAIFGRDAHIPHPASVYVCRPSATDPAAAPQGYENLFLLVPIPADASLGAGGSDGAGDQILEQAADAVIDQVAQWADVPDLRRRIVLRKTLGPADFAADYNSWRGGMLGPGHTLRQSAMFRAQNASRRVDGLYYAGATTAPGVGVPMCLISAELVLKRILGDHSPGPMREPTHAAARPRYGAQ